MLAGAAGDLEGLEALLSLRERLRSKDYTRAEALVKDCRETLSPYLDPALALGAVKAFSSSSGELALEPYLEDPHLGAEAWCALGLRHIQAGEPAKAQEAFEHSRAADPGHYRATTNLGNLYLESGNIEQAVSLYQEALKVNPDFALAHHNLAVAYRKQGKLDLSVSHLKKGQRLLMRPGARTAPMGRNYPAPMGRFGGRFWLFVVLAVAAYFILRR